MGFLFECYPSLHYCHWGMLLFLDNILLIFLITLFQCLSVSFLYINSKVSLSLFFLYKTGAELHLAAYEALAYVLAALSTACSSQFLDFVEAKQTDQACEFSLDILVTTFLDNINHLLTDGTLTRSRRAVLMTWKVRIISCLLLQIKKPIWMAPNC